MVVLLLCAVMASAVEDGGGEKDGDHGDVGDTLDLKPVAYGTKIYLKLHRTPWYWRSEKQRSWGGDKWYAKVNDIKERPIAYEVHITTPMYNITRHQRLLFFPPLRT